MNQKISDYKLVYRSLQIICSRLECDLIDLNIRFDKVDEPTFKNNEIIIPYTNNLLDVMASIYSVYINYLGSICGRNIDNIEARNNITNMFLSVLRDFSYDSFTFDDNDKIFINLNQMDLAWTLIKNIFVPYKRISATNFEIVGYKSSQYDVSCSDKETNKIFMNLSVNSNVVRQSFVFFEALSLHLKDEDPGAVIRDVFSNYLLKDLFINTVSLAFREDKDVSSFFAILSILCHSKEMEEFALLVKSDKMDKIAQATPYMGNWWFLGLTEKMLDAVRGADFSTTNALKDFSKELWENVEEYKKKHGLSDLTYESLLRIQSENMQVPPNKTLQAILSDARIW